MTFEPSRRAFLQHGSSVLALTAGLSRPSWTWSAERFVEAKTIHGRVRGMDADGIKTFKGIPYGASTAGPNRFRPPQPVMKWTGVFDALEYGPSAHRLCRRERRRRGKG